MKSSQLNDLIGEIISKNICQNQEEVNDKISRDISDAYNDNNDLSYKDLIGILSDAYMYSSVELSVKSVIDILVELNLISIDA